MALIDSGNAKVNNSGFSAVRKRVPSSTVQALIPVVAFTAIILLGMIGPPHLSCPVTYCVSLTTSVSVGLPATGIQPVLSVIMMAQLLAIAFAVSPSFVALRCVGDGGIVSALMKVNHLRMLGRALRERVVPSPVSYWLPIESVCAGRITSKMLRGTSFFGPGRP